MSQSVSTRTIHTITIDLQDDVLGKIEEGDEVEVKLLSRYGSSRHLRFTWSDIQRLVFEDAGPRPVRAHRKAV